MMARRTLALSLLLLGALGALSWDRGWVDRAASMALFSASPTAPTLVFVILDTVRADHTSLCGYDRPTTPVLESLRDQGASTACRAYSPGNWTHASHASYFTGALVPDHGAHSVEDGLELLRIASIRPLGPELPTLAEQLAGQGYQTAALSANPLVSPATGLLRGFEHQLVASAFGELREEEFDEALKRLLREVLDRNGPPLALFINLSDAHGPWSATSPGTDWLPEQRPPLAFTARQDGRLAAYLSNEMPQDEVTPFLDWLTDAYDHGIWRADAALGRSLELLGDHGWFDPGFRLVVTADHGENLGEHQLLDHGLSLYETEVQVPFLVWNGVPGEPEDLPEPFPAIAAHNLLLEGALPEPLGVPLSVSYPDPFWRKFTGGVVGGETQVALWRGMDKWIWQDGSTHRYDLAVDPGEERPLPSENPGPLGTWIERTQASALRPADGSMDMLEALKAAGYIEEETP